MTQFTDRNQGFADPEAHQVELAGGAHVQQAGFIAPVELFFEFHYPNPLQPPVIRLQNKHGEWGKPINGVKLISGRMLAYFQASENFRRHNRSEPAWISDTAGYPTREAGKP
jgi:hypothetical protein